MSQYSKLLCSLFSISTALLVADQPNSQMKMQPQGVSTDSQGMITPPVGPKVANGADIYFTGDFIWWKTSLGGLDYAIQGASDAGARDGSFVPEFGSTGRGRVAQPSSSFQPGFKLGIGLDLNHDSWDIFAQWTWLNGSNRNNSTSGRTGTGLMSAIPVYLPDIDDNDLFEENNPALVYLDTASARWKQNYNILDIELGRNFFISKRLTLRPQFGLKAAWINQNLRFNLLPNANLDQEFSGQSDGVLLSATQRRSQNMWGIGIRGGLDTVWHFSKDWGIYGDFALTTLWSDFSSSFRDDTTADYEELRRNDSRNLNAGKTVIEVIPILEMGLGFTYMTFFNNEDYMLQLSAGWEEQVWMDFNHCINPERNGNLSMHGLTVKAMFAF